MKISTISVYTALIITVVAEKTTVLDDSIYKTDSLLYTAKNYITDIHSSIVNTDLVFIVERKPDGIYNGLYTLRTAENNNTLISTKVLDNGKCTTSDNKTVFFGASDGIYTYNFKTNNAVKYGNITADVKAIQKHTSKDIIYVIANNQLKKITEKGTKEEKVESVNDVQEIVLDKENNVYLYEELDSNAKLFEDKYSKPKVIVGDKVIEFKGLPGNYNQMKLTRSVGFSEGALLVLDNRIYKFFANGSSVATEYIFENAPTAYYLDLGIIQLFGHGQKLYQFNLIGSLLQGFSSAIANFYSSIFNN